MKVKIKAIWAILTNQFWFVGTAKKGTAGDTVMCYGHYSLPMAETLINKHITDVNTHLQQESALNEFKNILNNVN